MESKDIVACLQEFISIIPGSPEPSIEEGGKSFSVTNTLHDTTVSLNLSYSESKGFACVHEATILGHTKPIARVRLKAIWHMGIFNRALNTWNDDTSSLQIVGQDENGLVLHLTIREDRIFYVGDLLDVKEFPIGT